MVKSPLRNLDVGLSRTGARGLTLIEVLVAISIASILTTGIHHILDVALTSWRFAIEEVTISQFSEETIRRMMEGDYELSGIRDAVELVEAKENQIAFVPLWTDIFDQVPLDGHFYLSKRIRSGAQAPVGEIKFQGLTSFKTYPTTLHSGQIGGRDWVEFGFPIKEGSVVRLSYHPDVEAHPELIMRYQWKKEEGRILRFYNGELTDLNLRRDPVRATAVHFTYYDGYNKIVEVSGNKFNQSNTLVRISAVKIDLTFQGKESTRTASSFINIRALGKSGLGMILESGVQIPIPDSQSIRVLQLINFSGVEEGQVVELKIDSPKTDRVWRASLHLGSESGNPILRHLEVFYPSNKLIFESVPDLPLQHGFDLLNMGDDGLYDYDDDEGVEDEVSFTGDQVTLTATRVDPKGAMLVIRP